MVWAPVTGEAWQLWAGPATSATVKALLQYIAIYYSILLVCRA